jgi:hypothetical protein
MPKNICYTIILLLCIVIVSNDAIGQTNPTPVKFKPPVVTTSLDGISGLTATMPVSKGKQIIDSSLKIMDTKGNLYTITYYEFAFTRVGAVEDDSTGKVTPTTELIADHFYATPLTDIWRKTIRETLVAGEIFHFTDIIVKDSKGNIFYAPELKIAMTK